MSQTDVKSSIFTDHHPSTAEFILIETELYRPLGRLRPLFSPYEQSTVPINTTQSAPHGSMWHRGLTLTGKTTTLAVNSLQKCSQGRCNTIPQCQGFGALIVCTGESDTSTRQTEPRCSSSIFVTIISTRPANIWQTLTSPISHANSVHRCLRQPTSHVGNKYPSLKVFTQHSVEAMLQRYSQGRNHVFKVGGGPIPWSRLLYKTKYGWYIQFCALLRKKLGWSVQLLGGGSDLPDPPVVAPLSTVASPSECHQSTLCSFHSHPFSSTTDCVFCSLQFLSSSPGFLPRRTNQIQGLFRDHIYDVQGEWH